MKSWLRWLGWAALAVVLPGGAVLLWLRYKRARSTPRNADFSDRITGDTRAVESLTQAALADANAIRASLSGDPLAQSLMGISPGLINATPEKVMKNTARAEELKVEILRLQALITQAVTGYARDHFGGQSPGQYQNYLNGINAQISAAQSELASL